MEVERTAPCRRRSLGNRGRSLRSTMRFFAVSRIPSTRRRFSLVSMTNYGFTLIAFLLGIFNLLFASVLSPTFLLYFRFDLFIAFSSSRFSFFFNPLFACWFDGCWFLDCDVFSFVLVINVVFACLFGFLFFIFYFYHYYWIRIGSGFQFWSGDERIVLLILASRQLFSCSLELTDSMLVCFGISFLLYCFCLQCKLWSSSTLPEFSRLVFVYPVFFFFASFGWQIVDQLDSMLCRYALDVNVERAEDVLMHKRLLQCAHDPANRPAIEVRLVQVSVIERFPFFPFLQSWHVKNVVLCAFCCLELDYWMVYILHRTFSGHWWTTNSYQIVWSFLFCNGWNTVYFLSVLLQIRKK